MHFCTDPDFKK